MTTVADFGEYTGAMGTITLSSGGALADVEYDIKWSRSTVSHSRGGKHSDIHIPGKLTVKTKIKKALVYADAARTLGFGLTDTSVSGTATACLAATSFTAGTAVPITSDPATASVLRVRTSTDVSTAAGGFTIVGTDLNDVEQSETLTIPNGTLVGTDFYTTKVFKLANYAITNAITGTIKFQIDGVAATASYGVGDPKIFDLVGVLTKGATTITITQPNCWFSSGGISWTDAGKIVDVDADVEMRDPDTLTVTVV